MSNGDSSLKGLLWLILILLIVAVYGVYTRRPVAAVRSVEVSNCSGKLLVADTIYRIATECTVTVTDDDDDSEDTQVSDTFDVVGPGDEEDPGDGGR